MVDFGGLGVDGGFSENSLKSMIFLCRRVYICLTYPIFGIFGGFLRIRCPGVRKDGARTETCSTFIHGLTSDADSHGPRTTNYII